MRGESAPLGEIRVPGGERVAWGVGVVAAGALWVPGLRTGPGRPTAVVARWSGEGDGADTMVLGDTLDDAPLPVLAASGGKLYAVYYARERAEGGTQRSIVVGEFRGPALQSWTPLRTLSEQPDESLSLDLAADGDGVVVVWDEDHGAPPRGKIVGARVSTTGARGPNVVLSPLGHDCESPTTYVQNGQLVAAWLVREFDEDPKARDTAPEGPAEARDRRWVEVRSVETGALGAGLPSGGAPRAITSRGGHVSSIAFAPFGGDGEGVGLFIFIVDEATRRGAVGGRVYRASHDGPQEGPNQGGGGDAVDGGRTGNSKTGGPGAGPWRTDEWVTGGPGAVAMVALGDGVSHWLAWEDGTGRTSVARARTPAAGDGGVAAPEPRWVLPEGLRPIGFVPVAQQPPSIVAVRGDGPSAAWVVWSLQP